MIITSVVLKFFAIQTLNSLPTMSTPEMKQSQVSSSYFFNWVTSQTRPLTQSQGSTASWKNWC